MSQIFRPSSPQSPLDPARNGDAGFALPPAGGSASPPLNSEQAFFNLDIRRSLDLHWGLARAVAAAFFVLAVAYFLVQVFVLKSWPAYSAESIVYVQPTPGRVLPAEGGSPRWPSDSSTYETYMQQQMLSVSRDDVLTAALHRLDGFKRSGESDQSAARRLVRAITVTREGAAYQFSITARSEDPRMAARIANALTASYLESASRDQRTGDAQLLSMLKEERDRIQTALAADRTEQDALNKQLGVASVGAAVPDHFDDDIAQIRTELVKARTQHDEAESKFASVDAGHGSSSAAIDAEAEEMITTDAGLVSMKTALNTRRAVLISQMANLTPANPQYKQNEAELARINGTLDAMMKDLRAKAAAHIQLQLRTDLERTAGLEAQLNDQLRDLVGAATSATPKMQRSSDLAADITRLRARYAAVDEQLHNLLLEDNAPAAAYQVTPAQAPLGRTRSGVMRNAAMIALAGLIFAVLAAAAAHKLDPRVYIASDVERVLGFPPLAQLPNFNEVSRGVAEEYMLRLASAIEHGRKRGDLKNCIFTGTAPGAGVTTLINGVRETLEAMGRRIVLVDATGVPAPSPRAGSQDGDNAQALVSRARVSRPIAMLQRIARETDTEDDSLVLTDTAPLSVSAETEYLARYVDCAIVVVESGTTTRAQLREVAATLQRLHVSAVGFVLNRVGLEKADPAFRASVEAVEKHLHMQKENSEMRAESYASYAPERAQGKDAYTTPPRRSLFEPEVAAAAAAVARFSPAAVSRNAAAPAVCSSPPILSTPVAEAAKRFSMPLASEAVAETAGAGGSPAAAAPASPAPQPTVPAPGSEPAKAAFSSGFAAPVFPLSTPWVFSPFAEAASHFLSQEMPDAAVPFPTLVAAAPAELGEPPSAPHLPKAPGLAAAAPANQRQPVKQPERNPSPAEDQQADAPWWLNDVPRDKEPVRPPVLWRQAKDHASNQPYHAAEPSLVQPSLSAEPRQALETVPQTWEHRPAQQQALPAETSFAQVEEQRSNTDRVSADRPSRLSGLRNLLFVAGVRNSQNRAAPADRQAVGASDFDLRNKPLTFERTTEEIAEYQPAGTGGASPRPFSGQPEFLSPRPVVLSFDKIDARVGESSTRQDRRDAADGVQILPSKRGQYQRK